MGDEDMAAVERLELLVKVIGLSDFDHLPIISRENAGQFQSDLRALLRLAQPQPASDGELETAIEQAAAWFDDYAVQHDAKGVQGLAKARTNRQRADALRAALAKHRRRS